MLRSRKSRREEPLGTARARADREPRGRRRSRARGAARRLGRARAARRAGDARSRRAARLRAARHVRRAVRRDRPDRRPLAGRGAAARQPRAAPRAGSDARSRTPISAASARSSTPSWRLRASGDFDALAQRCSTPTSCFRVDRGACPAGPRGRSAAPQPWSRQVRPYARLAPFARPALVNGAAGLVVGAPGKPFAVSASRSRTARSSRSTCSPTRPACASST